MADLCRRLAVSIVLLTALAGREADAGQKVISDSEKFRLAQTQQDSQSTRKELQELLTMWYPPSLLEVLQLDPTLLSNEQYMSAYPRLWDFLAQHPEVAHNPSFFLGRPDEYYPTPQSTAARVIQPLIVFLSATAAVGVLIWIVRTVVDHRRWLRVSNLQNEAHAKLMERFSSNEDLLAFIQTPAGKRFLESSAIPIEPRTVSAPVGRILWSAQVGLILLTGGFGFNMVSNQTTTEAAEVFSVLGVLVMALGVGFVVSSLASYILSKRLGLFDKPDVAS